MATLKTLLRRRRRRLLKRSTKNLLIRDEANDLFLTHLERREQHFQLLLHFAHTASMTPNDRRNRIKQVRRRYAAFMETHGQQLAVERAERVSREHAFLEAGRSHRRSVVIGFQRPVKLFSHQEKALSFLKASEGV